MWLSDRSSTPVISRNGDRILGRLPLYLSFLMIVLMSSVLVGFITYLLQVDKVTAQQRQAQLSRVNQRLGELQGTINDFNRRGDLNAIHREIARLSADPTLKLLLVVDQDDRVHFSSVIDYRNRQSADIVDVDLRGLLGKWADGFGGVNFDAASGLLVGNFPLDGIGAAGVPFRTGQAQLIGIFDISGPVEAALFDQQRYIIQQVMIYVVVLVLAFLLLYGNIRSRFNRIMQTARAFVAGDYGTRIALDGNDEFASIARTFDQMAKEIQAQHSNLNQLAHFDPLTQLPNRSHFLDQLERRIAAGVEQPFSVLFIDLDRFKVVNDSLGHHVGDEMLQVIAHRIKGGIKDTDTIARFGGDEFLILVEGTERQANVIALLGRLLRHIAEPMMLDGHPVTTTASIGVARFPSDGQTAPLLIQRADIAMYQAKARGKNAYHFYQQETDALAPDRLRLEHHLRQCIENGDVLPYFQPIYDVRQRRLLGLEALAHMPDGQGGMLPPDELISIIEETGMMNAFGRVMLHRTIADYQQWGERYDLQQMPYLALNLSCSQLDQPDFLEQVDALLQDTGVDPHKLEFEITESTIIRNVDQKLELLRAIRERGIRIAIDDFGTGYSSLSYLKKLPIDTLKIDRSFVRDINMDADDNAIIETIIAMAAKLGLGVVAEGVETREQLAFLRAHQCEVIQGYYFKRPAPLKDLWSDEASLLKELEVEA